jgi:hypothetical protein
MSTSERKKPPIIAQAGYGVHVAHLPSSGKDRHFRIACAFEEHGWVEESEKVVDMLVRFRTRQEVAKRSRMTWPIGASETPIIELVAVILAPLHERPPPLMHGIDNRQRATLSLTITPTLSRIHGNICDSLPRRPRLTKH